jgi:hypothetical protein
MAPVVGDFLAERHRHRHLRHDGRPAAADQAAIDQEDTAARPRRLDRGIHAGRAGADHQHVGVNLHGPCFGLGAHGQGSASLGLMVRSGRRPRLEP